jgi:ribonuclease T1
MGIDRRGRSRAKPTSIATTAVAVITALAVWWLSDGPGASDDPPPAPATSAVATPTHAPSPSRSGTAPTPADGSGEMPATDPESGLPYVAVTDLPPEAAETLELIDVGGPFPYDEDGSRFGNYEGILPDREDGYYLEYTVETPGLSHRGARRIVGGAGGELYWTEDHYESFERIWR